MSSTRHSPTPHLGSSAGERSVRRSGYTYPHHTKQRPCTPPPMTTTLKKEGGVEVTGTGLRPSSSFSLRGGGVVPLRSLSGPPARRPRRPQTPPPRPGAAYALTTPLFPPLAHSVSAIVMGRGPVPCGNFCREREYGVYGTSWTVLRTTGDGRRDSAQGGSQVLTVTVTPVSGRTGHRRVDRSVVESVPSL